MDLMAKYAELQLQKLQLEEQINDLAVTIAAKVETGGAMSGYGFKAHMKAGRKSIDHEAAAKEAQAPAYIIEAHTTIPAPRIAWAKVTKEWGVAGALIDKHTTKGDPTFVIEVLK